jgi:hypothetical protein
MLRQTTNAPFLASPSRPLGALSGIMSSTPSGFITSTSSTWTVGVHRGVLDLEASAVAGAYVYSIDAAVTGSVTAADPSNPRVDSLCIQLSDPAEGDGTTNPGAAIVYTAGQPGASGGARGAAGGPPNVPARSLELAQITVPKVGGGSPVVSMVAPYTVATGGVLPVSSVGAYPASPYLGQYIDDATLGLMRWNGAIWFPVGNPPLFIGHQAAPQSIPNNVLTAVIFDTNDVDTYNGHSTVTNNTRYVGQVAGWYQVVANINIAPNATGARYTFFQVNGAAVTTSTYSSLPPGMTSAAAITNTAIVHLNVADYVECYVSQGSGGALALSGAVMSVRWIHS